MRRFTDTVAYNIEAIHLWGIDYSRRTIYLTPEPVDEDPCGIDQWSAEAFIKNMGLLSAASEEPITVVLSTDGGSWDYGMAIYDAIKYSPCDVTTISYAHARSMSSIIPQAADHRVIMPHAYFMMHWGTDGYEGVSHGLQPYANFAALSNQTMLEIYCDRCQHSPLFAGWYKSQILHFLRDKMNQRVDWWLTAEQAVEYGLMDEVYSFNRPG